MEILEIVGIPYFKNGSGIHIKKENRGKFTEYCDGKVTQECINKAKKSNNPTLRKRATFAENARAWKHQKGGVVRRRINFDDMMKDPEWKNIDLYMNSDNLRVLVDSLNGRNASKEQMAAVISNIISEKGGDIGTHGNGAAGLVGWRDSRAVNLPEDLGGQAHKLMSELYSNPNATDWHHGGKGSGYQTARDARQNYLNATTVRDATAAMTRGYVRSPMSDYERRQKLAELIYKYIEE